MASIIVNNAISHSVKPDLFGFMALPLIDSDNHLRASVALENLLEEALAKPFSKAEKKQKFKIIKDCEDMGLSGKIDVFPHPTIQQMTIVRAQVRWGSFFVGKSMSMEYLRTRTKP